MNTYLTYRLTRKSQEKYVKLLIIDKRFCTVLPVFGISLKENHYALTNAAMYKWFLKQDLYQLWKFKLFGSRSCNIVLDPDPQNNHNKKEKKRKKMSYFI